MQTRSVSRQLAASQLMPTDDDQQMEEAPNAEDNDHIFGLNIHCVNSSTYGYAHRWIFESEWEADDWVDLPVTRYLGLPLKCKSWPESKHEKFVNRVIDLLARCRPEDGIASIVQQPTGSFMVVREDGHPLCQHILMQMYHFTQRAFENVFRSPASKWENINPRDFRQYWYQTVRERNESDQEDGSWTSHLYPVDTNFVDTLAACELVLAAERVEPGSVES